MESDVIRYLPDSVANQIAAGEVIQRPASVIKELVENAVDAGASEVTIILKDAGRTLIQVVDNGCGMSPTDARMAFERHATSKISSAEDLLRLRTMGFRGEALPSMAAVAQIDMRTMRAGDTIGTRLLISESRFEGTEPVSTQPGTNIMVKNIFFHMPARRKFLKKDSVELGHILREFERLALVNTSVSFTLIHNEVTLHQVLPGSFKQRIGALFGKTLESQLAPVSTETGLVKINGFIALPQFARKRGYQQFFFVNGRFMRHLFFHKTILRCYEKLISPEAQPSYFLNLEVDPATIDVNIHPQKYEVKFEHEIAIQQILEAAVRQTLGHSQAGGALDFDAENVPEIPLFQPDPAMAVPSDIPENDSDPFAVPGFTSDSQYGTYTPSDHSFSRAGKSVPDNWEKLYDDFERKRRQSVDSVYNNDSVNPTAETSLFEETHPEASPSGIQSLQLAGKYIITTSSAGLMVINQHRARLRTLYDRFMRQLGSGPLPSQQLIFSEDIELPADKSALLEDNISLFNDFGFVFTHSGSNIWNISSVPAVLEKTAPSETVLAILDQLEFSGAVDNAELRGPVALAMARNAAVAYGQTLTPHEMDALVAELFRSDSPNYTPDGQKIIMTVTIDELAKGLS